VSNGSAARRGTWPYFHHAGQRQLQTANALLDIGECLADRAGCFGGRVAGRGLRPEPLGPVVRHIKT
jgi:hypothetical protein